MRKEIKVALLGIVAIVALIFGYKFLKGSDLFSTTRTYYAYYDDVEGLNVSNPVVLNGVNVGLVKKLTILTEENYKIQVTLEVNDDIPVGDSTVALLYNSDILGSKAINLDIGSNTKRYQGGETLLARKQQGLTDMLTSKGMDLADHLDSTIIRINSLFDDTTRIKLRATISHTEAMTASLEQIMKKNQQNINTITSNLSRLSASLRETEREFNTLANSMNEIADTLKQARINEMVDNINATVMEAKMAMEKINSSNGSLGKLMNDDSLYTNLNRSTENLNALLEDIRLRPKRYVNISVIGRRDKYNIEKVENVEHAEKVENAQTVN
ncbi:MAG: MlaD family protein [Hymenobacteraceae bacterium]|nr:MlaD family protein [Hymenobacteraceae bacterium]MDX5397864.1 MlaD family protein [Hymenobacteraceae bacterium]MDX5513935.1 MlaD family protein [Hymenobacteraceae bacterium]